MMPIRMYNATPFEIAINKGERLAEFMIWSDDVESIPFPLEDVKDITGPIISSLASSQYDTVPDINIDLSTADVTPEQKQQLHGLLSQFKDCFVDPVTKEIGLTDVVECKIETFPNAVPVHKYPYRMAPSHRQEIDSIVRSIK